MSRHVLACIFLLALTSAKEQSRWSRQISSYTSDLSDWVPLPGPVPIEPPAPQLPPIKRQAVAEPRILAEPVFPGFQRPTGFSQDFPGRTYFNSAANRQLYLQSVPAVPSAPQNYLSDQGFTQGLPQGIHQQVPQQTIRFGLSQPNFPLNQGFVGQQFNFDSVPLAKPRPQFISNPITFPKSNLPSVQAKPFINQVSKKIEGPKFVDGYRVENISSFHSMKKPQSLQKLKYDTFDKVPKTEMVPPKAKSEREEVQLLYVPLEQLNRGQFNFRSPIAQPQILNTDPFAQNQKAALPNSGLPKQTFAADFQRPVAKPLDTFGQDYFSNFNSQYKDIDQVPKFSTISTPFPTTSQSTTQKPKKLKPHQPPLAIFLAQEAKKGNQVKVSDVLSSLKNANTVAVLDAVDPSIAPKVFIGPSNLTPPENFVKFELPYLSNIDHSDKKLRQLPFFVAPLSYNTPQGFAKIPFPSPHVGSVVINSQIKESSTTLPTHIADVIPNSYSTAPQVYKQEQKPVTTKPSVSFFTTSAPKTNAPLNHQSNYYSFEPQTVSTIRPPKEPQASIVAQPKPGSYFLSNEQYNQEQYNQEQYNPHVQPQFSHRDNFKTQEPVKAFNVAKTEPTTQSATVSSTTPKPSTYPSQLLETHNPYSINQAFHFSTPLDYHNLFEESYATPGFPQQPSQPPTPISSTPNTTPKPVEPVTEKSYQTSPNYVQNNYSPEIHYESELTNSRYPVTNTNDYTTKTEATLDYSQPIQSSPQDNTNSYSISSSPTLEYNSNPVQSPTQAPIQSSEYDQNSQTLNTASYGQESSSKTPYYQYETSYEQEKQTSPPTSTTTTTRRTPARNRGRPRYTTPKADSVESTTRTVATRRPLRERRPLPPRTRYEPNKITTERVTRKPIDSSESTTKYSRGRTRGRVHYKPTEGDDYSGKSNSKSSSKEADLAYQRDVLHQNYPVTLMERSSTVDIEAITEPVPRISSTKNLDPATEVYDTENAYSYDRASVSQQVPNYNSNEETQTQRAETQTYVPKLPSTREDYIYQSRSSLAPVDAISQYEDSVEKEEESYVRQTTPTYSYRTEKSEPSYATEPSSAVTEQSPSSYSISDLSSKPDEATTTPDIEITKTASRETTTQEEEEENVVQTTPSYNRVRVRPGVIRQYQQSSTETSRTKIDRRRPSQPVTYRPAFDRRRTTMRIEEIEADLKTKPVHARPEQEQRHPVYRPDPTTESSITTSGGQETTTKRGVFRRRRPNYTTTSTEASSATTKRTYEVKNRFRGRRPTTEKATTEKPEVQTDASTTTVRNTIYSRYTRPRLSERFNKKPEPEESDDQDSNYSIIKPKYVEPETEQWSPKISTDSFKPFNPNEITEEKKATTPSAGEDQDIITAKSNDYDDILLTVTPATNNRNTKKIPDIPPTLEALVEQSKVTKGETGDGMSTFESMLEEVMKNLEEQDEDEYTSKVMKHKGGEIGEIPPERIISSGDNYAKSTTVEEPDVTTIEPAIDEVTHKEDERDLKSRRRGFWKKVKKVRPATTESIEVAESQYYANTVNRLGHPVNPAKAGHDKTYTDKTRVTTYKPAYQFFKDIFDVEDDEAIPTFDIAKVKPVENKPETVTEKVTTEASLAKETPTDTVNPGEMDLGTGSPDSSVDTTYSTTTELTTTKEQVKKSDSFSFMDYLFGVTSEDDANGNKQIAEKVEDVQTTTEPAKPSVPTTESTYIPEEIITVPSNDDKTEAVIPEFEINKVNATDVHTAEEKVVETTEKSVRVESSSVSSYMDPNNVVSTSMSTEISHETEICFRGKCIKTSKNVL